MPDSDLLETELTNTVLPALRLGMATQACGHVKEQGHSYVFDHDLHTVITSHIPAEYGHFTRHVSVELPNTRHMRA